MPLNEDEVMIQALRCAFCYQDLDSLSIPQREVHYENHFTNESHNQAKHTPSSIHMHGDVPLLGRDTSPIVVEKTSHKPTPSPSGNAGGTFNPGASPKKKLWPFPKETDVFWYPEQTTSPPLSFTPGLIPLIRKGLLKGHSRGNIRRAVLCFDKTVHVNREIWDARWGCGYRNFLMACAALMSQAQQPLYFPLLDSPISPSVRNLQTWIEAAWAEGFDVEGQAELKNLIGTKTWVGASDLWTAFNFRRIPAEIVDFNLKDEPRGSEVVIDWVVNYFSPPREIAPTSNAFESLRVSPITTTDKMPIILQHNGHSRTIVGYEVDKNGATSLLTFDPAYRPTSEIREAALTEFAQLCSMAQESEASGMSPPVASSSDLKRKRSIDAPTQDSKFLRTAKSIAGKKMSSSDTFSPLKNEVKKLGPNREGKAMDLYAISRKFRLELKKLSKKKQYQILYFPMTAPLTDYERSQKKEVTCKKP